MSEQNTTVQKRIETINAKDVVPVVIEMITAKAMEYIREQISNVKKCIENNVAHLVEEKDVYCQKYTIRKISYAHSIETVTQIKDKIVKLLEEKLRQEYPTLKNVYIELGHTKLRLRVQEYKDSFAEFILDAIRIETKDEKIVIFDTELYTLFY
ncbi:MAG: hypothetical protein QXT13_10545 [Pyrobaculum sp.]